MGERTEQTNWIEPNGILERPLGLPNPLLLQRAQDQWFTTLETRYLVKAKWGPKNLDETRVWLDHRWGLFSRFTLPSVLNAEPRPDVWFLAIDEELLAFAPELVELEQRHPFIALLRTNANTTMEAAKELWFKEREGAFASQPFVLMARCDNDDALARDFFALSLNYCLKTKFQPSHSEFLTFSFGVQWIDAIEEMRAKIRTTGHFHMLAQPSSLPQRGVNANHGRLFLRENYGVIPVQVLDTWQPMWAEVVHGKNALNVEKPGVAVCSPDRVWRDRFGLDIGANLSTSEKMSWS